VACELSDVVAAVAPVSAPSMNFTAVGTSWFMWKLDPFVCAPERPVPLLHFHGDKYSVVPFDGWSTVYGFPSVDSSIEIWRQLNGVADAPPVVTFERGATECTWYGPDSSNVTLCVIGGENHCWPGQGPFQCGEDMDATPTIWEFFKKHTLAGSSNGRTGRSSADSGKSSAGEGGEL
jgi:poly(3-hydroxybutyrate) depolymerase